MKFEEALVELRKGKKIKRSCFLDYISPNHLNPIFIKTQESLLLNDIFQDDWMVEEPGKTFDKVFEDFKSGKKIRRKSWLKTGPISYSTDDFFISTYHGFRLYNEDLLATDWEVID